MTSWPGFDMEDASMDSHSREAVMMQGVSLSVFFFSLWVFLCNTYRKAGRKNESTEQLLGRGGVGVCWQGLMSATAAGNATYLERRRKNYKFVL